MRLSDAVGVGDLLIGLYLVLVIAFLAWQWARSPAIDELADGSDEAQLPPSASPAEQRSRTAA